MKSSVDHNPAEKQSGTAYISSGSKGISAPAVPVLQNYSALQKAEIAEEEPLQTKLPAPRLDAIQTKFDPTVQFMATQVIQRIKIGDEGADIETIVDQFPAAVAELARAALASLGAATEYGSVQAIVDAVSGSPDVSAALSTAPAISGGAGAATATPAAATAPAGSVSGPAAESAAAAPARRGIRTLSPLPAAATATPAAATAPAGSVSGPAAGSAAAAPAAATGGAPRSLAERLADIEAASAAAAPVRNSQVVDQIAGGRQVTEADIDNGTWRQIRADGTYELDVRIEGVRYQFHVHPPAHAGDRPVSGQLMMNGSMTQTHTSDNTMRAIMARRGPPAGWGAAAGAGAGTGTPAASSPAASSAAAAASPAAPPPAAASGAPTAAGPAKSTDAWD
jgi:hypothetical protein